MNCKHLIFIIICFLTGCRHSYEKEEFKAIEDISHEYLSRNDLDKVLNQRSYGDTGMPKQINIDSLDLKVYISDALMPIAQVKEDDEWMFIDNKFSLADSVIFYSLTDSKKFRELSYREFDKTKLTLGKPYSQYEKYPVKLQEDEEYTILKFSRVCFDDKIENGIVVLTYSKGFDTGTMSGFEGALLIRKHNNRWTYISH